MKKYLSVLIIAAGCVALCLGCKGHKKKVEQNGDTQINNELFKKAEEGDVEAQFAIGKELLDQALSYDPRNVETYREGMDAFNKARHWFTKASQQDYAPAEAELGEMLLMGYGDISDVAKAAELLGKAANQGNPKGQKLLGDLYVAGKGVPQNIDKAMELYKLAAEDDYDPAMVAIGNLFLKGQGVEKNTVEAQKWFNKAAGNGNPEAQYALAQLYFSGNGVVQNNAQAFEWCQKSAEQGYGPAQVMLGDMYASGNDAVTQDAAKAVEYYLQALAKGDEDAFVRLSDMHDNGLVDEDTWTKITSGQP